MLGGAGHKEPKCCRCSSEAEPLPITIDPGFNLPAQKKRSENRTKHSIRTQGLWVLGPTAARGIMQATLAMMVWMASSVSSSSYTASTLPDITNEDFIQQCVQIHNQNRSRVNPTARNMLYMVSVRTVFVARIHQRQPACV